MGTSSSLPQLVDEEARRRFEAAWHGGRPEPVESFLPDAADPRYLATLEELIAIDLEFGWKRRGESPTITTRRNNTPAIARGPVIEDYLARFPQLDQFDILSRLLLQEYEVRVQHGDRPSAGDYAARFPHLTSRVGKFPILPPEAGHGPEIPGYELLGEIGRGGMGVVYKARQLALGRVVALKVVLAGHHAGAEELVRFLAEAEIAARVRHQGVVQIYESGRHEGLPYFTMEYVDGGSLAGRLKGGPIPPVEAAGLVRALAEAVAAAHAVGVVHRDLKPANVLLGKVEGGMVKEETKTRTGTGSSHVPPPSSFSPKITDFGLARRIEGGVGMTATGAVFGTPAYMAPEQARGDTRAAGPAADVWALGAILYECLTGRPPFGSANPSDTLSRIIRDPPAAPRSIAPGLSRDLETVALTCLEKDPARRYPSAEALADDLRRYLDGRTIKARRVGAAERAWRWCRRNPAVAALLAAVFVALTAGTVVSTALAIRSAANADRADGAAGQLAGKVKEAEDARALAEQRVVRMDLATARLYADRTNYRAALHWAAKAWHDDRDRAGRDPAADADHRLRVGAMLEKLPELVGICFVGRPVLDADCDPAGRRVLALTGDKRVRVYDAEASELAFPPLEHADDVTAAAFAPDGQLIATASRDRTARVWDAATGRPRFTLAHPDPVAWVAFDPAGGRVVTAAGPRVRAWDALTGKPQSLEIDAGAEVTFVGFSPAGGKLVTVTKNAKARLWDAATEKPLSENLPHLCPSADRGYDPEAYQIGQRHRPVFSADGSQLVTTDGRGVTVWSAAGKPTELVLPGKDAKYTEAAFEPDGQRVVVAGRPEVVALRLHPATGAIDPLGVRFPRQVAGVRVSPDGRLAAVAVSGGEVHFRKIPSGDPDGLPAVCTKAVSQFRFTQDGRRLVVASLDGTVRVWAVPGSSPPPEYRFDCGHADRLRFPGRRFTADGATIAARVDGGVRISRRTGPSPDAVTVPHPDAIPEAFTPDGRALVTSADGELKAWDVRTGAAILTVPARPSKVTYLTVSGDGGRLAVRRQDGTVEVWSLVTRERVFGPAHGSRGAAGRPHRVLLNGTGNLLAAAEADDVVDCWDLTTGRAGPGVNVKRSAYVYALGFGPRTDRLVTATSDLTVRQWDGRTQAVAGPTVSLEPTPRDVVYTPDERRLIVVNWDRTAFLFDAATGDLLADHGPVPAAYHALWTRAGGDAWLAADGRRVVFHGSYSDSVAVWELPRYSAGSADLPALARLVTGLSADGTGSLSPVGPDEWLTDPAPYRAAWRNWRGKRD